MINSQMIKELREKTGAGMLDCKKALEANEGNMEKSVDWLREKGIAKAEKKASRIAAEGLAKIFMDQNKALVLEMNVETDFVAKNQDFIDFVDEVGNLVIQSDAKTLEEVLKVESSEGTLADLIISKTAKIGEKISLRRVEVITKTDDESFGAYLHLGGKIAVLTKVKGSEEVAKDVAMHVAAMNPKCIRVEDLSEEDIERERTVLTEQAMNEGKPEEIAKKMVEGRMNKYYKEVCLLEQPFVKDSDLTVGKYIEQNEATLETSIRFEVGEGMEKRNENFAEEVMGQING